MLRILFCLLAIFQSGLHANEYEVSIAAIFRDEARFLKEWIDYHLKAGVEHFWLYDDVSSDHPEKVLEPYIQKGIVELIDWSSHRVGKKELQTLQIEAYKDAVKRAHGKTDWLALIDLDEFILPMKSMTIPKCLKTFFSDAKAVYMQWLLFGTSGITLKENEPMLRRLTHCMPLNNSWNCIGKSIVRPEQVLVDKIWYCHHFPLRAGGTYRNGSGGMVKMSEEFDLRMNAHEAKHIRLNHYFFKDEKFLHEVKIPRKVKQGIATAEALKKLNNECNKNTNYSIVRYLKFLDNTKLNRG